MIYFPNERGDWPWRYMLPCPSLVRMPRASLYSCLQNITFAGLIVGPIMGGYIVQGIGVKYIFVIASALCGTAGLIGIPFLKETYAPVVRLALAETPSDPEKVIDTLAPKNGESLWDTLWLNLSRPVMLLTRSFICFILSLYFAM